MDADITIQKEPADREVDSTVLSSRSLYQHDPLLVLLKDKLHLGTLWIVGGGFVFGGLFFIIYTPIFNNDFPIINNFHPYSSLGDTLDLMLLTLAMTLSLLIYLLLPVSMASVFNTLRANGVIGPSRQERLGAVSYARFLEHVVSWVDSRWWSIAIVMLGTVYFLYSIFITNPQLLTLPTVGLLVIFVIGALPFQYFLFFGFLRVMFLLIFINRLFFLFSIRVRPLHPDGSGGLAALSQMWWMSAAIIFVTALVFLQFLDTLQRLSRPSRSSR